MGIPIIKVGYGARLAGPWRAVRVANKYLCGICRKNFESEADAWNCVEQCLDKMLALDPVIVGRRNLKQRYFCRFCAREFLTKNAAKKCAGECSVSLREKHKRERELVFSDAEKIAKAPPGHHSQAVKVSADLNQEAAKVARRQPELNKKNIGLTPADLGAPASESPSGRKTPRDVPDDEKFFRDAAKYACKECSERYFTRLEVIRCYDAHE